MTGSEAATKPDRIELVGLRIRGHHGVLASEREVGQDFVIDAIMDTDIRTAAASDALIDTVNYAEIAHRIADIVAGEPVDLIETLAERIAVACLEFSPVIAVEVVVHKPQAPVGLPFDDVRVRILRTRNRP